MSTTHRLLRFARVTVVAVALFVATGAGSFQALFAPSADLWQRWESHDPTSTATIDHSAWNNLLGKYLVRDPNGVNRFAYGRVTEADRAALETYLNDLSAIQISVFNRPEQLAFWINLYNALTIRTVIDAYPVETIRDIDTSPGLFGDGPWDAKLIAIEGEQVTLNDIEHRILRPIWRDPRIHYAVNCASIGCPNLQQSAYTGANTQSLLATGARAYVNHPRGAVVINRRLTVSSIYVWFEEDFGGSEAGVISHLRYHADPPLAEALATATSIAGHNYDWQLNDAKGPGL